MAGDVGAVRSKAHQYLTGRFEDVHVNEDGDFSLQHGSVRIFVKVRSREDVAWTWVALEVPLLFDVPEAPAVFEYVALHADDYTFGHLNAHRTDTGLMIFLSHTLLGDFLDEQELVRAVGMMLFAADRLVDGLAETFGGSRFNPS